MQMNISDKKLFKNKRFLITGGCGFMGSNFIHLLLNRTEGSSVVNVDKLTYAGNPANLQGVPAQRYRFVRGDVCNVALMKKLMSKADFVVNFAAETHVDRSIHLGVGEFLHTNILGVHSLLEALRAAPNVLKMLHVSTDEVWGDLALDAKKRFNEQSSFRPNSPYAASKAAADLLIRSYVRTHYVPVIISHSGNNFGPRQFPEKLIPFFVLRALRDEPLPLYGDGCNVRDWVYVDDHSTALLTLLEHAKSGDVYGISSGEEYSNLDIARRILHITKKPLSLLMFVADRPAHDRRYAVDASKLKKLGWQPKHSVSSHLGHTVHWYQQNQRWVKKALQRKNGVNTHIVLASSYGKTKN